MLQQSKMDYIIAMLAQARKRFDETYDNDVLQRLIEQQKTRVEIEIQVA